MPQIVNKKSVLEMAMGAIAEMTPQVPGQVDMDGDESPVPAMARVGRAGY